ncbi:GHKL domain-containing protein [Lachnoclostridium pacaense]|uniref:sensor histidine kinase n=1 Tax=Enterocloster hominis (ex Hitch et al. 2024) TaxID=1917870 RepID=UPI001D129881|nr:sensor histidine kinase [Lachnoclostridium pacaense]MCC2818686.1 GHKL domain-containing protein [Lachnoclostridium pacaense]
MNNWYEALEIFSDFIEAWLCYHFIGIFLPDRVRGRLPFFLLSLTLVCSVKAMDAYGIDPLISTLWFVFFICMTTVVLFQVDLFYAVSLVSFYFLCLYIINFFCMSVMGVIAGNRQFAGFILNQLSLWRCAYIAVDKAMLFCFSFLAGRAFRKTTFYNPKMIFTVSLFGILGVGFLSLFTLQEISVLTLFSWGLCLVILLCLCLLMLIYANYVKERELRGILEFKDQLVRQEYEMVKQMQKEQETLSHNMKNHLLVLDGMLAEDNAKGARAYIGQLSAPLEHLTPSVWTGTPTLDVLLNHARNRCAQAGIRFTVQADAMDLHPMEDQDICSLFANLLDNAYEAASHVGAAAYAGSGQPPWIHVKIRKMKEMLFIDISNSATHAPCKKDGRLISVKRDSALHGIGLNSASMSAARYGGHLEYEYKDHVFSVRVSFLGGIRLHSSND